MSFFDVRVPFFLPLWRRLAACGIIGGWAVFEMVAGDPGWGLVFAAAAAWLIWSLLIQWIPPEPAEKDVKGKDT